MIRRTFAAALLGMAVVSTSIGADAKDTEKEALQKLNEYIGSWKGTGEAKVDGKNTFWKQSMSWGWKFSKDGDSKIAVEFDGSKQFKSANVSYDVKAKKYVLTATTADGMEEVFTGNFERKELVLKSIDAESKDVRTLTLSTNNDGARLVYDMMLQTKGKGLSKKVVAVQNTKEGASLAGGKKNECVVTGGLGTMAVSFKGKTYYVCCSGCRDAFNEDPEKIIAEFEKKKK